MGHCCQMFQTERISLLFLSNEIPLKIYLLACRFEKTHGYITFSHYHHMVQDIFYWRVGEGKELEGSWKEEEEEDL